MDAFFFEKEKLLKLAKKHLKVYSLADPFPHVIIDDFLPPSVLNEILEEFPSPQAENWIRYKSTYDTKLESRDENKLSLATRHLIAQFNSSDFLEFLEALTGIKGLISDPHLFGGGLHQIVRGGFLKIHADFNRHPRLQLDRRINLLLFLNKEWKDEYGGHLELWDTEMTKCVKKIRPLFNRCVIFNTTDNSFHGHPDPLKCPEDMTRKSLALYYYTNGRPEHEKMAMHSTLWQARHGEKSVERANTLWRVRETVKSLVPPLLWAAGKKVKESIL